MEHIDEEEAKLMLKYFWEEKGDITRWVYFDDWCEQYPEQAQRIKQALASMEIARAAISHFIKEL